MQLVAGHQGSSRAAGLGAGLCGVDRARGGDADTTLVELATQTG